MFQGPPPMKEIAAQMQTAAQKGSGILRLSASRAAQDAVRSPGPTDTSCLRPRRGERIALALGRDAPKLIKIRNRLKSYARSHFSFASPARGAVRQPV